MIRKAPSPVPFEGGLECLPEDRAAPALMIEPTGRRFAPPCPSPPRVDCCRDARARGIRNSAYSRRGCGRCLLSPKAATSPPGWGSFRDRCPTGDRTILGEHRNTALAHGAGRAPPCAKRPHRAFGHLAPT